MSNSAQTSEHRQSTHPKARKRNAWEQRRPWHIAFALLLLFSTALAISDPETTRKALVLVLASMLAGWYIIGIQRGPERWAAMSALALIYTIIGWGLWYLLTDLDPAYMLLLFALFPHNFIYLQLPWAGLGAIALNLLVVIRLGRMGNILSPTWMFIISAATVAGIALAYYIGTVIDQSQARQNLIRELEATRADLATAERSAGTLAERQRLAREIHDTLTQGFISIVTHLEAAEGAAANAKPDVMQGHITRAKDAARANLVEARRFVWALRSTALDAPSLAISLRQIIESRAEGQQLNATFVTTGHPVDLSEDAQMALLRVLQESLSNIIRHAGAKSVNVTLSYIDDVVVLDVQDDGRGFSPDAVAAKGFGLRGMRERITAIDGHFDIESVPGEGTTIVVEIPVKGTLA